MSDRVAQDVDPDRFKQVLSRWPAGVSVVTVTDGSGRPWGFTASSFTSVSLSPPLVLVCLAEDAECAPAFADAEAMAINILSQDQGAIAWGFASRQEDKFAGVGHHIGALGAPLLEGVTGTLECSIATRYPGGDHSIILGRVRSASVNEAEPLVFAERGFHRLVGHDARA